MPFRLAQVENIHTAHMRYAMVASKATVNLVTHFVLTVAKQIAPGSQLQLENLRQKR